MPHLNDTEFIDLLDGTLEASRAAHGTGCPECSAELNTLRGALVSTKADAAHEPSPLFWNSFPSRVAAALEDQPRESWWGRRPVLAALGCAAALLIVLTGFVLWPSSDGNGDGRGFGNLSPQTAAVPIAAVVPEQDVEEDAAWAVVRTAAEDLNYEDALAAGISAEPGAAERAAMELSAEERAELVRLIEREIKRTGA
jgi:hypothetical protein